MVNPKRTATTRRQVGGDLGLRTRIDDAQKKISASKPQFALALDTLL
jgi:hypothetical protein